MSRRRILCLFLFVISISGAVAAQAQYYPPSGGMQRPRPAQTGTITMTGVVVNSVTGEPISRALVQLSGMTSRAALTDSDGKFEFDNLPETQAMLMARKPGYFSDMELRQGAARVKPIAITTNMGSVTVKLTPAGVVTGRITTPDGEPVESTRVHLKMRMIQNGRRQWTERNGANTDEDGLFRIGNLLPGTYYLYADGSARGFGLTEEVLAPAYYPGVAEVSGASPLEVRAGSTTIADLVLRKEKAYRIAGVVTGLQPGQGANVQLLGSGGDYLPVGAMVNSGTGSFELRRVPAGSYTLKVVAQQRPGPGPGRMIGGFVGGGQGTPRMPQTYTGSVPITVTGDLNDVNVALQPSATVPVVVRADFSSVTQHTSSSVSPSDARAGRTNYNQQFQLALTRTNSDSRQEQYYMQMEGPAENPTPAIRNVEPGRYRAEFTGMGGTIYVQSARYGTTDILHDDLVITGGESQPIEVVLRDDAASLTGTVNCGDIQCWVLVTPEGASAVQPRMAYVNPQGTFQQLGLAPGSYRVYAFDRIDGIEFTNPEAMKALSGHAETVVLSAGQKAQLSLELTKVSDQ